MKKHILVFAILLSLSVVCPTSLKAAVAEEYKSIESIHQEQLQGTPSQEQAAAILAENTNAAPQIQNNITLNAGDFAPRVVEPTASYVQPGVPGVPASVAMASALPGGSSGDVILEAAAEPAVEPSSRVALTPMAGAWLFHAGSNGMRSWGTNIRNQYSFGLALELPISPFFSIEAEGGYANQRIAYTPAVGPIVAYTFNQYLLGGNGQIYLLRSKLRPFIGGGLAALFYENMSRSLPTGGRVPYEHVVGSLNLMAGVELALSESVVLGARASLLRPVLNRPVTSDNGVTSAPGFEEPGVMNTNVYRVMGTIGVRL